MVSGCYSIRIRSTASWVIAVPEVLNFHYQHEEPNMTTTGSKYRAYQLDKLGSLDGLVLTERDMPSPGVGEVLVRVRASSLNFRDMMILNGAYPPPVPPGRVPLSDGAGEGWGAGTPAPPKEKAGCCLFRFSWPRRSARACSPPPPIQRTRPVCVSWAPM